MEVFVSQEDWRPCREEGSPQRLEERRCRKAGPEGHPGMPEFRESRLLRPGSPLLCPCPTHHARKIKEVCPVLDGTRDAELHKSGLEYPIEDGEHLASHPLFQVLLGGKPGES